MLGENQLNSTTVHKSVLELLNAQTLKIKLHPPLQSKAKTAIKIQALNIQ